MSIQTQTTRFKLLLHFHLKDSWTSINAIIIINNKIGIQEIEEDKFQKRKPVCISRMGVILLFEYIDYDMI